MRATPQMRAMLDEWWNLARRGAPLERYGDERLWEQGAMDDGQHGLLTRAELGNAAALLGDALAAHGERDAAVRTHCGRALQRLRLLGVG